MRPGVAPKDAARLWVARNSLETLYMILPLDVLIGNADNVYALTCAAIRRASQITLAGDEEVTENDGKVVSTAIKQILTKKVEYRLEG